MGASTPIPSPPPPQWTPMSRRTFYGDSNSFTNYGDFQLIPEVVRYPHFEVPYPQLKRGQQSLGALVAVVRPFRYIYGKVLSTKQCFVYFQKVKSSNTLN